MKIELGIATALCSFFGKRYIEKRFENEDKANGRISSLAEANRRLSSDLITVGASVAIWLVQSLATNAGKGLLTSALTSDALVGFLTSTVSVAFAELYSVVKNQTFPPN